MSEARITHIGGPTVLIEVGGWSILTDPTFDPPGGIYHFGLGTSARKRTGPAVEASALPPIDAILLSHDLHGDNLDAAGRALLPSAGTVLTTPPGARRLGGNALGLKPWQRTQLEAPGRTTIDVTATPGRHGPPLTGPLVGAVTGFALRWDGQRNGVLWVSGDTVLYGAVRRVAERFKVGTAVIHLGGVRFPRTGPLRYTMNAEEAVRMCQLLQPNLTIPVHYEGWQHFHQGRPAAEQAFAAAPTGVRDSVRWLPIGVGTDVTI